MQLTKESQEKIKRAAASLATTETKILVDNANDLVPLFISDTAETLTEAQRGVLSASKRKSITKALYKKYSLDMFNKKGSECVSEVIQDLGNGNIKIYSKKSFVSWLSDIPRREIVEINKKISIGSAEFKNPKLIAKSLEEHFNGTRHNAITSARTESLKLQTQANTETRKESGQKYIKYISALTENTRPHHAARNDRIFEIGKEIPLGDYNCLCTYVSADYEVEIEGKEVSNDTTVIMNKAEYEAATGRKV